jgi:hypothetical protein
LKSGNCTTVQICAWLAFVGTDESVADIAIQNNTQQGAASQEKAWGERGDFAGTIDN